MGIGTEPSILEVSAINLFVFNAEAGRFVLPRLLGAKKLKAMKLQQ